VHNRCRSRVLFFFYAFALPILLCTGTNNPDSSTSALSVRTTIQKIRASLNRIKPFKIDFTQQVLSELPSKHPGQPQVDVEESGEILFKNDQTLKWTYLKPDYKVFLLENDDYRFYDQENEQLIIGKIKDRSQQWVWQLLFSDEIFKYARIDSPKRLIRVKDDDETLNLEIAFNSDFLPEKMVQIDASGARMVYYFRNYRKNISIPDDAFHLKIPDGVEIIREDDEKEEF